MPEQDDYETGEVNDYRTDEYLGFVGDYNSEIFYDKSYIAKGEAIINICRTLFVCTLLGCASYFFNRDATNLVLNPIDRMMEKIRIIQKNPMALCDDGDSADMGMYALAEGKKKKKSKAGDNEVKILEDSLTRIGKLLVLCFGEAGAKIIGSNLAFQTKDEEAGEFSPLIAGNKIISIFGFCDIRGFLEVNEVLQQGIMTFVNQIAEVVHTAVDQFSGNSNKNLGEAFLFVWKFPDSEVDAFDGDVAVIEGS